MTMFDNDTKAEDFIRVWSENGYIENWSAYDRNYYQELVDLIIEQPISSGLAVEIGPGGGTFTGALCDLFEKVIAADILPNPPSALSEKKNLVWLPRRDKQFNLIDIEDASADLIFSFGTFCHFSFEACASYLSDIRRVLKPTGVALVMFGNWKRHPGSHGSFYPHAFMGYSEPGTWFYQDETTVRFLAEQTGLAFEDMWPTFRDTMAKFVVKICAT